MAPARKKQKLSDGVVVDPGPVDDIGTEQQPRGTEKDETAEQQRRSLFVRSLPASTTTQILTDLFSEFYPVKHATAVIDPATKQCRGYGFVTFADSEDAQRAKKEFNGHSLDGRKLRIEVAEPRQRDTEGSQPGANGGVAKAKRQPEVPQSSRLIVRNLPWTVKTSDQLGKLFMSYGKIKHAYIPKQKSGLMAGFGFVVLRGRKNAEKALEAINGKEVDGRTLAVDWAVSKDVYEGQLETSKSLEREADHRTGSGGTPDALDIDNQGIVAGDGESGSNEDDVANDRGPLSEEEESEAEDRDEEESVEIQLEKGGGGGNSDMAEDRSSTLFVRNLPFTCTDEDLEDHFSRFGSTRYARIVLDHGTERSKGTGFVCFYNKADADTCLRGAPRRTMPSEAGDSKDAKQSQVPKSILQNEAADPSGQYTMDGRVLQVSRAVDKSEANRLTDEGAVHRRKRDGDKRRLYLLSEGTLSTKSKLWEKLSPSERTMREASAKQRKTLIESNPSLHLSLTRLSIRNIPRSVDSKELKALAREAVVGFATDAKAGIRQKLSKEELARGGEEMLAAEHARKKTGKGVVKQAKVVFEGAGGSKVSEDTGAGRSRGYGFIEYYTHRSALMGLRWLNGHAIGYHVKDDIKRKASTDEVQERKKRLIVEFAIENAQVVMRRKDREVKAKDRAEDRRGDGSETLGPDSSRKRKRGPDKGSMPGTREEKEGPGRLRKSKARINKDSKDQPKKEAIDEKLARRNQIIGRKRAMRRARKGSK